MNVKNTTILFSVVALAACGGPGFSPAPSAPTGANAAAAPMTAHRASNGPSSCYDSSVQAEWVLMGACRTTRLSSFGGAYDLETYDDVAVRVSLPANNGRKAPFAVVDAMGGGDIHSYDGAKFPPAPQQFTNGSPPVPLSFSIVYVELANGSKSLKLDPSGSLSFAIRDTHMVQMTPGVTSCYLSVLAHQGSAYVWRRFAGFTTIESNAFTVSVSASYLQGVLHGGLPAGSTYFNVSCDNNT
jgi:hypothetical protein